MVLTRLAMTFPLPRFGSGLNSRSQALKGANTFRFRRKALALPGAPDPFSCARVTPAPKTKTAVDTLTLYDAKGNVIWQAPR